jgi:AraC-like DNA-binding protein
MDKRVRAVLAVLDEQFAAAPDFHRLAEGLGIGLPRLEHLFKRDTGRSMRDYIRERRIGAAAKLLAASSLRISEIGSAVGFPDSANFAHVFKQAYGVCPREYRILRRIEQLLPNRADSDQV